MTIIRIKIELKNYYFEVNKMKIKIRNKKEKLLISLIIIMSAILNFANLGIEGNANTYYSAGVRSMMMNLKNFFFVSSDPSGFVTIDKPPVGFWLQTISAKIFGFSGWSVILPQALAGVISVWVIYRIVKRAFGSFPALFSAFCLAITPIFVAASRNNTIDNLLVLSLLLGCYSVLIAAETGKLKYLILSVVIIGIGFNIKMVEAYMVAPAVYITYLLTSTLSYKIKIKHLIIASVVLLVVSVSWAVTVDLVPKPDRPFIGSSTNNSVMELIIGHNGLERLGISLKNTKVNHNKGVIQQNKNFNENKKIINSSDKNSKMIENRNKSNTGIFRLFTYNNLSEEISWLLPFAILGFFAAALVEKFKFPFDNRKKLSLLLWITWLITEFIYFSFSKNVTHTYYLTTMAPAIAALSGIGLSAMWKLYNGENHWKWLLPTALMVNGIIQIAMLSNKSKVYTLILIITLVLSFGGSLLLYINNIKYLGRKISVVAVVIAAIGVLTSPAIWSATTIFYPMNGSSPSAGLELMSNMKKDNTSSSENKKLVQFLLKNKGKAQYLVAVPSATDYGSYLILKTGMPVITIGGYSGMDKIISLNDFKKLVYEGKLKYALIGDKNGMNYGANNEIINWIKKNGKLVNSRYLNNSNSTYKNISTVRNYNGKGSEKLYYLTNIKNQKTKAGGNTNA